MKKIILSAAMLTGVFAMAQTGINTTAPAATLEVKAKTTDGSAVEGVLLPRVSKLAVSKMKNIQDGTIVYINDIDASNIIDMTTVYSIVRTGVYIYKNNNWENISGLLQQGEEYGPLLMHCTKNNVNEILFGTQGAFICFQEQNQNYTWMYAGLANVLVRFPNNEQGYYVVSFNQDTIALPGTFQQDSGPSSDDNLIYSGYDLYYAMGPINQKVGRCLNLGSHNQPIGLVKCDTPTDNSPKILSVSFGNIMLKN